MIKEVLIFMEIYLSMAKELKMRDRLITHQRRMLKLLSKYENYKFSNAETKRIYGSLMTRLASIYSSIKREQELEKS